MREYLFLKNCGRNPQGFFIMNIQEDYEELKSLLDEQDNSH